MENILCSSCDYKFSIDEINNDKFFICSNPNCFKILCDICHEMNNIFLNVNFEICCNCSENENNRMSISTSETDELSECDDDEKTKIYYADF